jgi:hypothetical protein
MKDEQFEDLKLFIDSRIFQSELSFDNKLDLLRKEILDGFSGVGEAIREIHKQSDENKAEFDQKLKKLEQQAA